MDTVRTALKEIVNFIEQFSSAQFKKIETFFATMPKLKYEGEVINPNTGVDTEVEIEVWQIFRIMLYHTSIDNFLETNFGFDSPP